MWKRINSNLCSALLVSILREGESLAFTDILSQREREKKKKVSFYFLEISPGFQPHPKKLFLMNCSLF